jgi:type VII secretion protein EccB
MYSRRDQLQAYRFVNRRLVAALLSGEPETTDRPMRRFGLGVFGSTMVAAIVFAAVGVYGLIVPTAAKLPDPAIVIEQDTGARYVYVDSELHPVVNFASARLVLRSDNPQVVRASAQSLAGYARGPAVGIANLPDPLPTRAAIVDSTWSACSLPRAPGSTDFVTQLVIGPALPGGQPLADQGLLILQQDVNGPKLWLLTGGHRLRVVQQQTLVPLGLAAATELKMSDGVLGGIPPGPNLEVPAIAGLGQPRPALDNQPSAVGQLYVAAGQYFILLDSGLATVGPVMLKLLRANNPAVTTISASIAAANRSPDTPVFDPDGFPTTVPTLAFNGQEPATVCVIATPSAPTDAAAIDVYGLPAPLGPIDPAPPRIGPDQVRLADHIVIPGGQAALVRELPAPGDSTLNTTTYLVTDQGVRYALPRDATDDVLTWLGYGGITPAPIPKFLLALLPVGPTLDPEAARQFVIDAGTPSPTPSG